MFNQAQMWGGNMQPNPWGMAARPFVQQFPTMMPVAGAPPLPAEPPQPVPAPQPPGGAVAPVNPAPPVEPPREEKPPLPPDPPPAEEGVSIGLALV